MWGKVGCSEATQPTQSRQLPGRFWALLALTAGLRSPGLGRPLLGTFATKNVVYAMIARNWALGNASPWYPTLDCLAGAQRAWHLVEFPVSAYLTAWLWALLGGSLDVWGRATSVLFSVGSVALLFVFVRRRHGQGAATAAALALALAPVSIIYGQSFMLEASLVLWTMATFYTLDRWLDRGRAPWLVLAGVCFALLLLTKIYMLVLVLPLALSFFGSDRRLCRASRRCLAVVALLAVLPAAAWYTFAYCTASPDGPFAQRVFYSVRQSTRAHWPPHPLLWSPEFYGQVLDDLSGVALTPIGFVLLWFGLLHRRWRAYVPWLLAMVLLVFALPRKFDEMNYYYLPVLPPLCIMVGLGWEVILARLRPGRTAVAALLLGALAFSLRYAARPAFVTPREDRPVLPAARALGQLAEEQEPVVTMHGTGIDLLYYCGRPGWAVGPDDPQLAAKLRTYRRHGARYLVVVGPRPPMRLKPVTRGEGFRIYRLPAASAPRGGSSRWPGPPKQPSPAMGRWRGNPAQVGPG